VPVQKLAVVLHDLAGPVPRRHAVGARQPLEVAAAGRPSVTERRRAGRRAGQMAGRGERRIPALSPLSAHDPGGSPAAHENSPRGREAPCRAGVEVGGRMVSLSPALSGPRRYQAPRTVASRPRDSTRSIFSCGERLTALRRKRGLRWTCSTLVCCGLDVHKASVTACLRVARGRRRSATRSADVRPFHARAAGWTGSPPPAAHVDGVDRSAGARSSTSWRERRALPGQCPAREDGAGAQDGRARQRGSPNCSNSACCAAASSRPRRSASCATWCATASG
jgi:hypothetical protein